MENNPLKQYFRRPAVYLKLPSGGRGYSVETVEMPETGELPVYPMTAIDDITVKTPDALFNGTAVVELIKSCIPAIKDPWHINNLDLDAILIAIKAASNNGKMEVTSVCPSCKEDGLYDINLLGMLSDLKVGDYSSALVINDISIFFKPLQYREMNSAGLAQFEIQKLFSRVEKIEDPNARNEEYEKAIKEITYLTMKIMARTISHIHIPDTVVDNYEFILEFIQNCDKNMYDLIKEHNAKLRSMSEIKPLNIKCVNCGHDYRQPFTINASDFFG